MTRRTVRKTKRRRTKYNRRLIKKNKTRRCKKNICNMRGG